MGMNMSDERAANLLENIYRWAIVNDATTHAEDEALAYAILVLRRRSDVEEVNA